VAASEGELQLTAEESLFKERDDEKAEAPDSRLTKDRGGREKQTIKDE
jgi:hypothetical protein